MASFLVFFFWLLIFAGICAGFYLWYRLAWTVIQRRMSAHYGE